MPTRRATWSSWNYLTISSRKSPEGPKGNGAHVNGSTNGTSQSASLSPSGGVETVSLTYNMNKLQHIPRSKFGDVLVTMNPPHPPNPVLTQAAFPYSHPLYNPEAVKAQSQLPDIQGTRGVYYAGAWTGYGFHEDGFTSGLRVGMKLGGTIPWKLADAKFSRGRIPTWTWKDCVVRLVLRVLQHVVLLLAWVYSFVFGISGTESEDFPALLETGKSKRL